MINTVIFDMDGVLVDSEPIHQRTNMQFFKELGVALSEEFYKRNFVGLPLEQMLLHIQEQSQEDLSIDDELEKCNRRLLEEFRNSSIKAVPGVEDVLSDLKSGKYNLAVGSSSSPELIREIIRKIGLEDYFGILLSGYEVKRGKPNPDLFLKIAEDFHTSPENCLVIEDSLQGLKAARQAGMKAVAVAESSDSKELSGYCELNISDFSEDSRKQILQICRMS